MRIPRWQRTKSTASRTQKAARSEKSDGKALLSALAVPVIVTVIGAWAAQSIAGYYGRQQREIAQAEAAEKFLPYFDKDETKHSSQQRYLAVQSLIAIGNYDAAADLVVTLPHCYAAIQKAKSQEA